MGSADGHTSLKLVSIATVTTVLVVFVILLVMAIIVHYTDYMTEKPFAFIFETIAVGVFASIPIFIAVHNRMASYKKALRDFMVVSLKFSIFWVLMELAGINAVVYPRKTPKQISDVQTAVDTK